MNNELYVGIDLGTTNSVLSIINQKPNGDIISKVVNISRPIDMYNNVSGETKLGTQKTPTIPSCVYYRQERNYEPLVGDFAKRQYPLRPHLVAKSIKSQMGKPLAEGLSPDIPDKTPAEISARILKHMLNDASKQCRFEIKDAIITVPANFDSVMCKATRDAAELAGIKVKNADGSERAVLLSEPNAVIYDLINQIRNGEIPNTIMNLDEKQRVLVFDLGGGTLDITMHEIKRRDNLNDVLKVDEIATNRYTLLGGDDFDEQIANIMYQRYLKQYSSHSEVVSILRQREKEIMPQLRVYAENLKLELSERCNNEYDSYSSGWDDDDEDIEISIGGNMGGIGYSYDDTFTKEEIEDILSVFMGDELNYNDYNNIDSIKNTKNIIYPILDVLNKAAVKLGVSNVKVDAVIVNGGMSKFYMITDRLKQFFGFEPIVALDPDQAVARGAAVYHYYLHKYEQMQDDMKIVGASEVKNQIKAPKEQKPIAIEWGNSILNDTLYLGAKNGAVQEIVPTGAELPYTSNIMTGFKIEIGQNKIAIPIKSKNIDGTYRTIASGNISFKQNYKFGAYVAFQIHMDKNKVIAMNAWTSTDEQGKEKIEQGYAEIAIDNTEQTKTKTKFIAPDGSKLNAKAEIHNLIQLCNNFERTRKGDFSKRATVTVKSICGAANKEDFVKIVLDELSKNHSEEVRMRLFIIARKIGDYMTESQKKELESMCMSQLATAINGFSVNGSKVNANIQAIYTLSVFGSIANMEKLKSLHKISSYLQACLYAHAKTKTDIDWIEKQVTSDIDDIFNNRSSNLQNSVHAIGVALHRNSEKYPLSLKNVEKLVLDICDVLKDGALNDNEIICCILALGCICDQREYKSQLKSEVIAEVLDLIKNIDTIYTDIQQNYEPPRDVAVKMITGQILDSDEEKFLLTKLER